jgi:V/A-type H+-transporting ATPase subunit D
VTAVRHIPPGRAGRLWLQRRIAVAERGADLLDQKLRILHAERQRFGLQAERTAAAWAAACREADGWLLRGALLGGQRALRLAADQRPADVQVGWAQVMGVRYPADATCTPPPVDPDEAPPAGQAVVAAREAHRRAAVAAVQHAAASAALRVVDAEEAATRRRLRAIQDRWAPRLRAALEEIELALDEQEQADGVRLRWAAGRRPGREAMP